MVMAVLVVEVVLAVLRVIALVRVVVVVLIGVVVAVVVDVMVVLVITFDQPHFQELPYILSYVITLKLNLIMTPLTGPCSCDRRCQAKREFWGGRGGGRERRMFVVILEAAPVQTVVVTVLSSRGSCRSRTVNVKDLLPLFFFLSFFYRCK